MKSNYFGTNAIHGGQHPDPSTGAVMPPIYQTSTYAQASPGDIKDMNTAEQGTLLAQHSKHLFAP